MQGRCSRQIFRDSRFAGVGEVRPGAAPCINAGVLLHLGVGIATLACRAMHSATCSQLALEPVHHRAAVARPLMVMAYFQPWAWWSLDCFTRHVQCGWCSCLLPVDHLYMHVVSRTGCSGYAFVVHHGWVGFGPVVNLLMVGWQSVSAASLQHFSGCVCHVVRVDVRACTGLLLAHSIVKLVVSWTAVAGRRDCGALHVTHLHFLNSCLKLVSQKPVLFSVGVGLW